MIAAHRFDSLSPALVLALGAGLYLFGLVPAVAWAQGGPPIVNVKLTDDRTPVQVSDSDFCPIPGQCSVEVITVPEGQRLVVEHIGVRTTFAPAAPGSNAAVRLNTQFGDEFHSTPLGATTNTGAGLNSVDVYSSPVKLLSQSGSVVRCIVLAPNFQTFLDMSCTITGYIEPED